MKRRTKCGWFPSVVDSINAAYAEIVHWWRNLFLLPFGKAAKAFVQELCSISTVLTNVYRDPAQLFVSGETLLSMEGTTHGDPLAMAMYWYSKAVIPLNHRLADHCKQIWYADDANGGGRTSRGAVEIKDRKPGINCNGGWRPCL